MSFPSTLDSFSTHNTGDVIQAADVNNVQTAALALETKVGVDSSAVVTTLDYLVKSTASTDPGHKHTPSVSLKTSAGAASASTFLRGDNSWISVAKFGGTGSDGALNLTSTTTTVALASATYKELNYTSISISSSGTLNFSSPATNGTTVVIKCQGNCTLSATTSIDASILGGAGGASVNPGNSSSASGNSGSNGQSFSMLQTNFAPGAAFGSGGSGGAVYSVAIPQVLNANAGKYPQAFCGAGGASGGGNGASSGNVPSSGAGGVGGGCLIIEVAGTLTFTGSNGVSVAGGNGGNATTPGSYGAGTVSGGGGGGAGGYCLILYNVAGTISGTVNVAGGTGGTCTLLSGTAGGGGGGGAQGAGSAGTTSSSSLAKTGGNGANGYSSVALNTSFA